MSEILVNTIKKADGTGSITVPADSGTLLTSGGAIDVNASAPADSLAIDASGRVGIGTSSPSETLSVSAGADGVVARFTGASASRGLLIKSENALQASNLNTIDSRSSGSEGILGFATDGTERMRIDSSGNVGIGTSSPSAPLTVNTGAATDGKLRIESNSLTGQGSELFFSADNASAGAGFASISVNRGGNNVSIHDGLKFNVSSSWSTSAPVEAMRIDSSGDVLIGTTAMPGTSSSTQGAGFENATNDRNILRLSHNADNSTQRSMISFHYKNSEVGTITSSNSSTAYNTTSDYRLKENVVDLTDAITRVKSLAPKRFNFIADDDDTTVDGFLAHEAQAVVPEAVTGEMDAVKTVDVYDEEGNVTGQEERPVYQGIDQSKLVPLLTGALQEAIAKIETLETTVADLQTRVTALETP